jgi:hypothetical protein
VSDLIDAEHLTAFESALSLNLGDLEDGIFTWEVPDGWQQGRGAWGGLVIGAQVSAVGKRQDLDGDSNRRVRTISSQIFAPVPVGPATISVECLRRGSGMSTWQTMVRSAQGEALTQAVVITATPRATDLASAEATWGLAPVPALGSWQDVPIVSIDPPLGPVFSRHLEYRPRLGIPMSGGQARAEGWIGLAELSQWNAHLLLGIADAWWPAAYTALPSPRPMATVSFGAHLLIDPTEISPAEPLLHEAFVTCAEDGFTSELRRLWTPDGRLVVENHQSIVVVA